MRAVRGGPFRTQLEQFAMVQLGGQVSVIAASRAGCGGPAARNRKFLAAMGSLPANNSAPD